MKEKRSYKNPYHQTQSELAEWLALFAQDFSTTEVADALVERYPERSTGDAKADHRLAKEAICTVNPNDSRYNAEKWAKQYRLMQANYITEVFQSYSKLTTKALRALNAAYYNLESAIPALSPKEQVSLVPKALLTLSQAVKSVKPTSPPAEQDNSEEETEANKRAILIEIEKLKDDRTTGEKARVMLREGKSFDGITAETGVAIDAMKNDMARQRVEEEVLEMYKNGMNREGIQERTGLAYAYIDSLIDNPNDRGFYQFDLPKKEDPAYVTRNRTLSKNGNGEELDADSDAARRLN